MVAFIIEGIAYYWEKEDACISFLHLTNHKKIRVICKIRGHFFRLLGFGTLAQ